MTQYTNQNTALITPTRMIAMGTRPLMEGFSLLGFEVWSDAKLSDLENLLYELIHADKKAFILLESYLSKSNLPILNQVRSNGGKIIVTEVPGLNAAKNYQPYIEDLVTRVLGKQALKGDL